MYSVYFSSQALESISKLDKAISDRILKKIEWFAAHFNAIIAQSLRGKFQGVYKLAVGGCYTLSTQQIGQLPFIW